MGPLQKSARSFRFTITMSHEEDPPFRAFYELCSMIIDVLKIPPLPIPILRSSSSTLPPNSSPAVFASLFIGISLALILFGTITLLIGFVLMPVVTLLLLLFYFFNVLSILSNFARSMLCACTVSSLKDVSAGEFLCFFVNFGLCNCVVRLLRFDC